MVCSNSLLLKVITLYKSLRRLMFNIALNSLHKISRAKIKKKKRNLKLISIKYLLNNIKIE